MKENESLHSKIISSNLILDIEDTTNKKKKNQRKSLQFSPSNKLSKTKLSLTKNRNSLNVPSFLKKKIFFFDEKFEHIVKCIKENREEEFFTEISKDNAKRENNICKNLYMLDVIKHIMQKNQKTPDEILVLKSFLSHIQKFVCIFKDVGIEINDLMGKISCLLRFEDVPAGRVICKEGDRGDKFYLILKGGISILISKEKEIKGNIEEYIQYLIILYLYQESSLLTYTININFGTFKIDERSLISIFSVFKIYKLLKEKKKIIKNGKEYDYQFMQDFLLDYPSIRNYVLQKMEYPPEDAFKNINADERLIRRLYDFYVDKIKSIVNGKFPQFYVDNEEKKDKVPSRPVARTKTTKKTSIKDLYNNTHIDNFDIVRVRSSKGSDILTPRESQGCSYKVAPCLEAQLLSSVKRKKERDIDIYGKSVLKKMRRLSSMVFNTGQTVDAHCAIIYPPELLDYYGLVRSRLKGKEIFDKLMDIPEIPKDIIYSVDKKEYIDRSDFERIVEEYGEYSRGYKIYNIKVKNYKEVNFLAEGNVFGEIALINSTKKRTASVVVSEDAYFGSLTKESYDLCLKGAQDKQRLNQILFFLNGPIFKDMNSTVFVNKFFGCIRFKTHGKGAKFFSKGDERDKVYFITRGEAELSLRTTLKDINDVVYMLGGKINDKKEQYLCYKYQSFKDFYEKKVINFRFCVLKDREILGLDDLCINDKYIFDCVSIAPVATEAFHIDYPMFMETLREKKVHENTINFVTRKRKIIIDRIFKHRNSIINYELMKFSQKINLKFEAFLGQNSYISSISRIKGIELNFEERLDQKILGKSQMFLNAMKNAKIGEKNSILKYSKKWKNEEIEKKKKHQKKVMKNVRKWFIKNKRSLPLRLNTTRNIVFFDNSKIEGDDVKENIDLILNRIRPKESTIFKPKLILTNDSNNDFNKTKETTFNNKPSVNFLFSSTSNSPSANISAIKYNTKKHGIVRSCTIKTKNFSLDMEDKYKQKFNYVPDDESNNELSPSSQINKNAEYLFKKKIELYLKKKNFNIYDFDNKFVNEFNNKNITYKTYNIKRNLVQVLTSEKQKKKFKSNIYLKEFKLKTKENNIKKKVNNFFFTNQHIFGNVVKLKSNSNTTRNIVDYNRNKLFVNEANVVDPLYLDNWVEKKQYEKFILNGK